MKKIFMMTLLLLTTLFITACNPAVNELVDYTNGDLQTYNEMWESIEPDLDAITYFTGSEEDLYAMYESVIAEVQKQLDFVQEVSLQHDESIELHAILISSVEKELLAYTQAKDALDALFEGDEETSNELFEESSKTLAESYEEIDDYNNRLDELVEKYDLEYTDERL
ncbi:hypothetical protein MM221_10990 [Salipaludibacillus sp. LMS25]|jgi:hypothetical protein|uniref:hypothetical protein n=1 Tax=Salipaludibacillus sp. LMS25 TaxID=2924031 RepID=UPI0020D11879|nr:hypothetical protein [Salipaludibacillus sp. LMS25]UTR13181.1 hypothetical protein MM221_10990 [Salipaludibacillus sp. LMS25]